MKGNFSFGGIQRSYTFDCFHADMIPNTLAAVYMPNISCEQVVIQNKSSSTGNAVIGSERVASVGGGVILTPGQCTSWIPLSNLALIWHKEFDATTFLEYMLTGCDTAHAVNLLLPVLLQQNGAPLLLEDGDEIAL